MSPHEEDRLIDKLTTVIDERLATRPIRFCAEHEALKKRTWWGGAKVVAAALLLIGAATGSIWWVNRTKTEAIAAMSATNDAIRTGYVDRGTYTNGQDAQDRVTSIELGHIKSSMAEVKTTVADLQRGQTAQMQVLSRIEGKLGTKEP